MAVPGRPQRLRGILDDSREADVKYRRITRRLTITLALVATASAAHGQALTESLLDAFTFRNLGPFRTGAWVTDFAVPVTPDRDHLYTFWVATRNGGLWKTVNNGTTFEPMLDDVGPQTIGAVAVAPTDSDIVWVGTGEAYMARYTYSGDGVYRSTDGGGTWRHMGLDETHHIVRILIHPRNPDIVYVATMGHLHGPNPERGVFRTMDGGATWEKVLYADDRIGVIDLVMSPGDPDVLYAATYEKERLPWTYDVGGQGSGIWKSIDGGDTWARLREGLPDGEIGRIGIDVFRGDPQILYAVIENANARPGDRPGSMRVSGGWGEVYRSDDAGATWRMTHGPDVNVGGKAPYSFNMLRIDPSDPDRVYVTSDGMLVTEDGGRTWSDRSSPLFRRMFGDIRTMWIDPDDPERIYVGSDGGVNISYDRGRTVDYLPNLPIGEIYALTVDMEDPYNIYVGLQDHESWKGPINGFSGNVGGIESWVTVGTGDGMYQAVDPVDSRWVYNTLQFGGHVRTDQQAATMTRIQPPRRPEGEPRHRYTWTTPIVLSPHDPAVVYTAAQVVMRSPDRGDTWVEISPDLTTNDPSKINGAGNIQYCTITTVAESPLTRGEIWAGTDDGRVQVTRDDGANWTDVTAGLAAPGAPEGYWVTRVVPSKHTAGTAYVTITGFHRDDFRPLVYRTTDWGANWTPITTGLDVASANVIAEDHRNPRLLFLGTDHGLFASIDGGAEWVRMQSNMPVVPVRDLIVHPRENDLVVGTHGRGVYVTDITPLQQLTEQVLASATHLFEPEAKGLRVESGWGNYRLFGYRHITTPNEPNGVLLDVYRNAPSSSPVVLRITDEAGNMIRELPSEPWAEAGIQRIVWNLRDEEREEVEPGDYTVTLEADGVRRSATIRVRPAVVLPRR
jgi:photosystem II stability/assembly factor-like uncharacterized protein